MTWNARQTPGGSSMCNRTGIRVIVAAALAMAGSAAQAAGGNSLGVDFADTFFRYTGTENKPFFSELPGETVDPFTGSLHIVQQDLLLPGRAGLDLSVVRSYTSKIWSRADQFDDEALMAERDNSILGYGWSLHFGRLRGPWNDGTSYACGNYFPIYQEPDGTSHVFYPSLDQPGVMVSKEYWRLEHGCGGDPSATCVYSDKGVRYEFAPTSVDGSGNTRLNGFQVGSTNFAPVTAIVDPFGNRISVFYLEHTGAPDYVVDTYGRTVRFTYSAGVDGRRLTSMEYNRKYVTYDYLTLMPEQVFEHEGRRVLPGPRRFLSAVSPPAGPPTMYDYAYDVPVVNNQYALSSMTYPSGGTTSYAYEAVPFFTGLDTVLFSVVTHRTVAGRDVTPGEWSYSYSSPAYGALSSIDPRTRLPTDMHVTTITRPDGRHDTYTMYGFGWVANHNRYGFTYAVGLTAEIARGDRSEVEHYEWSPGPAISDAFYGAPLYGPNCVTHFIADLRVFPPVLSHRWLERDGATFETTSSDFDAYGQPQTVVERGYFGGLAAAPPPAVRTTTTTYFYALNDPSGATLNMVRGKPLTQTVCVGSDCLASAWRYDEPGHPLHAETRSGVTTTYDHASNGDLVRVTDAVGHHLELSDYAYGIPRAVNYNGAFTTRRTVTWEGWVEDETNGRGYTTTTLHDDIGRPARVTPPGQSDATEYTYAPTGSWTTSTRLGARPYAQTTYRDGLGRVTSTIDSEGVQTRTRYDSMGRAWFKSYPFNDTSSEVGDKFDFDALGRVTLQTRAYRPNLNACDDPYTCTVYTAYSNNCVYRRVSRDSQYWPSTWSCSSSFGDPAEQRLAETIDPSRSLWQYSYSTAGNVVGVTAPIPAGDRTYQYDQRQFLESETTPESGVTTYGRNAIGQMTSRTDARNITVSYHYDDPLGRLTSTTHRSSSADDVTMDYDAASNVTLVSSQNGGRLEYEHDELNRVTAQTWTYGEHQYSTLLHYDSAGCLDTLRYPTGTTLRMTCDSANRVTGVQIDGDAVVSDVVYHPTGHPSSFTYANGVSTLFGIDDRGRVSSVTARGVMDLRYGYDGADNVVSIDDFDDSGSARRMTYDIDDRLHTVTADGMWGVALYEYDDLGNRTGKQQLGATVQYDYDAANRLVRSSEAPDRGHLLFTWDDDGRLASSSDGVTYRYDGGGRRVAKIEPTRSTLYHYDPAGRVIAETLPDGTKLRDYVYLGATLIAVDGCISTDAPPCNEREWYHTDTLGSAVARTNAGGVVVSRLHYGPWGEEWSYHGVPGDRQYNGRVYDPGTGFHDYGARMYWPEIGRFISADSYHGDIANPASLNRYSYVLNNPYKYVDPTGHVNEGPPGEDEEPKGARMGGAQKDGEPGTQRGVFKQLGIDGAKARARMAREAGNESEALAHEAEAARLEAVAEGEAAESEAHFEQYDQRRYGAQNTEHGQARADQAAAGDVHRQVGDANRVIRQGRQFVDAESGHNVHVDGNRVVITDGEGNVVTRFLNSRANTLKRIESGRWVPAKKE